MLMLAFGIFIGAAFGVLIMALCIAGKEEDMPACCKRCYVWDDETADSSVCFNCNLPRREKNAN